jgi:bacterioferritin
MNTGIINTLNKLLKSELIGMRQYLLNGIKLRFDGHTKLAEKFLEEAYESGEGAHAEILGKRILMLGGDIDCSILDEGCKTSHKLEDILNYSLELEKKAVKDYDAAIKEANDLNDFGTADILTEILREEEEHRRWLELQLELIKKMGLAQYIHCISCC